ncbi:MAG TPA: hypothetical protein VGP22_10235, partial [Albitalea sp.]|nr:hypothetical protein [Albitalea sp.]
SDPWITVDAQTADGFRISVPARPAGTYAGSIEVTAGAFRRVVPVTHIATARRLKLDRAQLDFAAPSGSTAASDVTVLQLAEGASDISVTASAPWIAVDSLTPSGFRVTAQSLPSGGHQGQVTVRSGNDVMVVPLSYVVTPPDGGDRGFLMGRSSFTFAAAQGTVSAAQSFNIARPSWNPAIGIAFSYAQGSDWLSASTTTGGDVLLVASAVGLATGTYRADVTVTPAYPAVGLTIPVMLTVGQGLAVPAPQTLVMGSDSSSATLRGSVPVVANGATSLFWTATSSVPWLQLTQASGGPGSSVEYRIDVAAALLLPGYTDHAALITIDAGTPDGPGTVAPFDSMQASVTLRRELAEVQAVGPANIVAGRPARIVLRGRGLGGLDVPAASLDIGGVTPVSVSRLNDSSMTVQLPALAAGSYDLGIKNAFGAATPKARLHVVAAQDYAPDAVATSGTPRSLVYDPLRQTLYVANETLSVLQRTRFDGSAWITDSLALPSLIDVGLSASGDTVIAITSTRLHLIDAATFTVSETFDVPDSFVRTPPTGHGLAVTNDERVWLAVGNGWSQMVYFDLPTHRFVVVRPNSGQTLFYGGPWYEVSRDGERLVIVQSAQVTPAPKALYLNASEHVFRDNPAGIDFFYWSTSGLSDTGDRLLVNGHIVFDADFAQVGRIVVPDAGWSPGAAV